MSYQPTASLSTPPWHSPPWPSLGNTSQNHGPIPSHMHHKGWSSITEKAVWAAFVNLMFTLSGAIIWEFQENFRKFDVPLLIGRWRRPWSFWIYFACRISLLATFAVVLGGIDALPPFHFPPNKRGEGGARNCHSLIFPLMICGDIAYMLAMALMTIRITAVWDRRPLVLFLALAAWISTGAIYLRDIISFKSSSLLGSNHFLLKFGGCGYLNARYSRETSIVALCSYSLLLALMVLGLVRSRRLGGVLSLWKILYRQSLQWIILTILAEVPVLVLVQLNINVELNMLFQIPRIVISTLGATQMYRSLYNFGRLRDVKFMQHKIQTIARPIDPLLVITQHDDGDVPIQVSIHVVREELEMPKVNSGISPDEQESARSESSGH